VLTCEIAYESILKSARRTLHGRVADALERRAPERVSELAHHLIEARQPARALPYAVEAADRAARSFSMPEAIAWYRRAVTIVAEHPDPPLARRAYEGLGRALELRRDLGHAVQVYRDMLAYAETNGLAAMKVSALNRLSAVHAFLLREMPEAEEFMLEAERLAREHDDVPGLIEHATIRCATCVPAARFEDAFDYLGESIEVARGLGLKDRLAEVLTHYATTLLCMTRLDDSSAAADEARSLCEELGDLPHLAELLCMIFPMLRMIAGETGQARATAEEGGAMAARLGAPYHGGWSALNLGTLAAARGEYGAAADHLRSAVSLARDAGDFGAIFIGPALSGLGAALLAMGAEPYQEFLDEHGPTLDEMDEYAGATVWSDQGFCALGLGDLGRAAERFDRAITRPTMTWLLERPRALAGAALTALMAGRLAEAAEYVARAREEADARGIRIVGPFVDFVEGEVALAGGDAAAALERFRRAAERGADMDLGPVASRARARIDDAIPAS
jgi:tetratricopeptide (TPR) repeat protein